METQFEDWKPAQWKRPEMLDFRGVKLQPKAYKERNKRKRDDVMEVAEHTRVEQMEEDIGEGKESHAAQAPAAKRLKDTRRNSVGVGKGSGRVWKSPAERAVKSNVVPKSWERKQKERAARQAFKEQKEEALGQYKEKLKQAKEQRAAARKRKEENRKKSEVVQKISKAATIKKMLKSKKQRSKLRTADTSEG